MTGRGGDGEGVAGPGGVAVIQSVRSHVHPGHLLAPFASLLRLYLPNSEPGGKAAPPALWYDGHADNSTGHSRDQCLWDTG